MSVKHHLGIADYGVISITLLISAIIGIKFRFSGGKQSTVKEYLLAGRDMSRIPVILSITVTLISAVTMLGIPAEVYRYGFQYVISPVGTVVGMIFASYVFVPVYFQCGVSTVYEFLEIRYGKYTRYIVSSAFLIQSVMFMSVALYGPALALSAVTDLPLETSNIVIGGICTFYCCLGGLKAVLWTDAFQALLMISFFIAFFAAGVIDAGGLSTIYERASLSGRLNVLNFNFASRYSFWNSFFEGFTLGVSFGINQLEVQRLLSLESSRKAKTTLQISVLPVLVFRGLAVIAGLILFSLFYLCDPIKAKCATGLTRYDQMIPYYIVTRFSSIPGLTGLCMAGIFGGSLSTISSAINSLSTVTIVDFVQPVFSQLGEKRTVFAAKGLCIFYGLLCICFTFAFASIQSLTQIAVTLFCTLEGPILAVFLVGVLSCKGTDKCMLVSILISLPIISWISFGSLFSGYLEPPLPLGTQNCNEVLNIAHPFQNTSFSCYSFENNTTTLLVKSAVKDTLGIYKVSFLWFSVIGLLITITVIFFSVLITGWKNDAIPSDSKCLSPVTRFWLKKSRAYAPCPLATNGQVCVKQMDSETILDQKDSKL